MNLGKDRGCQIGSNDLRGEFLDRVGINYESVISALPSQPSPARGEGLASQPVLPGS